MKEWGRLGSVCVCVCVCGRGGGGGGRIGEYKLEQADKSRTR